MELMQLEMFVAVVEEGSVQKAAARVYRTQPAVSMALRKLEQEIGASLLDRSHRQDHRLTPAGQMLYDYATRMLALRNQALAEVRASCAKKPDGGPRSPSTRRAGGSASNAPDEKVRL